MVRERLKEKTERCAMSLFDHQIDTPCLNNWVVRKKEERRKVSIRTAPFEENVQVGGVGIGRIRRSSVAKPRDTSDVVSPFNGILPVYRWRANVMEVVDDDQSDNERIQRRVRRRKIGEGQPKGRRGQGKEEWKGDKRRKNGRGQAKEEWKGDKRRK